jgi:cytochrome c biogenesis protein CcdA/thiol-disulfide isomerase/thioredoxin
MAVLVLVSLLVGAASVLTPCVLPLLPAILAASAGGGRSRSWGIVVGLAGTFGASVLALGEAVSALGLPANTLRWIAVGILFGFGAVLLVPALQRRFTVLMEGVVARGPRGGATRTGFGSGVALGSGLGLVWSPCAGPLLASVTAASATGTGFAERVQITLAYMLGMSLPLGAIVLGGAGVGRRLLRAARGGSVVLPVMGVVLFTTGAFIGTKSDTRLNAWVSTHTGWSATPFAGLQQHVATGATGGGRSAALVADHSEALPDLGAAPEFAGISRWYNTANGQPLTMAALRGRVVLVDFWTYSCINCLRALPHVKQLWDRYRDRGLVVVGVHTPEFRFEADPGNVADAIERLGVRFPVALDPDDTTWARFHNRYWPAQYLIDQRGHLRATHDGEGAYERTETQVRRLLAQGSTVSSASPG